MKWLVAFLVLTACTTKDNPAFCDENSDCRNGFVCNPTTNGCEQQAADDAGIDVLSEDAPIDAQGELAFTVIYGDQWWITAESYHRGWFLLLANGTMAPDVSTLQVVSVNDTHPVALFRVTANQYAGLVGQGNVAGDTTGDGSALFNAAITESRERTTEQYLTMQVLDAPYGEAYDYQAQVELSVSGIRFSLDLQIHHPSEIVYHEPMVVVRKPIYK
ncbi:MAG: hypothetical protein ACKV2T_20030 [Kofleriaceae bacterium]